MISKCHRLDSPHSSVTSCAFLLCLQEGCWRMALNLKKLRLYILQKSEQIQPTSQPTVTLSPQHVLHRGQGTIQFYFNWGLTCFSFAWHKPGIFLGVSEPQIVTDSPSPDTCRIYNLPWGATGELNTDVSATGALCQAASMSATDFQSGSRPCLCWSPAFGNSRLLHIDHQEAQLCACHSAHSLLHSHRMEHLQLPPVV